MKNFANLIKTKIMKQQTSATTETCTKGRTVVDFSGQTIYVGIDVHQKDYQVAKILDGICLGNHRMGADSKALINHLQSHYPGALFKCVYESCAWGVAQWETLPGRNVIFRREVTRGTKRLCCIPMPCLCARLNSTNFISVQFEY